ncbi:MAG: polysaccharide biosynthesis protein, partial [Pseudorhodobacter sp.]|nr:polysaccharide biosynthesis protein [Pseudorhodobacter sp.]
MISKFFQRLFDLPRGQKRAIQLVVDTGLMLTSFGLAMALRLESLAFVTDPRIWAAMLVVIPFSLVVFMRLGFYRAVIRFISAQTTLTILLGIATSAILLALVSALTAVPIPRSVPAIYAMLALLSVGGVRFALRAIYQQSQIVLKEPVIIYGGG